MCSVLINTIRNAGIWQSLNPIFSGTGFCLKFQIFRLKVPIVVSILFLLVLGSVSWESYGAGEIGCVSILFLLVLGSVIMDVKLIVVVNGLNPILAGPGVCHFEIPLQGISGKRHTAILTGTGVC